MHDVVVINDPLLKTAERWLAEGMLALVIEVLAVRGSVPRGPGTRMLVSLSSHAGTIGGGRLEFEAIAQARTWLATSQSASAAQISAPSETRRDGRPPVLPPEAQCVSFSLGPSLGQCCGGAVDLRFIVLGPSAIAQWPAITPRFHLLLFGAGHVGQAIVNALAPLPVSVLWIDERDDVFDIPPLSVARLSCLSVDAPEAEVRLAPPGSFYLVATHRHDLDLLIVEQVLRRDDTGFIGLIGSATKRVRFERQLQARGIAIDALSRLHCPIGLPHIVGKEPAVIAASVVAQMLTLASGQ